MIPAESALRAAGARGNPLKAVWLTGGNGFLGGYLCRSLYAAGFPVVRIGRSLPNEIRADLSAVVPEIPAVAGFAVVHAMGKAHSLPRTQAERREFRDVNVNGTRHLIEAIRRTGVHCSAFVFISSVAVYGVESGQNLDEATPLRASDPYGLSKTEAERAVREFCTEQGIPCVVLRLPLLAGSNPPGNLGAMLSGIKSGRYLRIGDGSARRSVTLARNVADHMPRLFGVSGTYNLTDGCHPSLAELEELICRSLHKRVPISISPWIARLLATVGDRLGDRAPINTQRLLKLTSTLTFSDQRARSETGWAPDPVLTHWHPG